MLPIPAEGPTLPNQRKEILTKIAAFKESAINHAINFIANDAKFAETKELKDIVSIVDTIEKSYGEDPNTNKTTINIAMQNMIKKYNDDI